jgi:nucleotide-binding universal stress UspA family protein
MLKKIVVGVDGREGGADAAALAASLAGPDTDVVLVGVYRDPLLPFPITFGHGDELRTETERIACEVRDAIAPDARTLAICDSFPARALRHVAQRVDADLLVLGSTHRADMGAAGIGRRARQVLHHAACPVAIAARGVAQEPGRPRRIVVGLDESPESHAALAMAADLLDGDESRISVVGVVEDRLPTTMMPFSAPIELGQWEQVIEARRGRVERLVDAASADGRRTTEVRVGYPPDELADAAKAADLLVVGSRRWGAFERIVVGSTAEELLRRTPCSLLLVPRPAEAAATPAGGDAGTETVEERVG